MLNKSGFIAHQLIGILTFVASVVIVIQLLSTRQELYSMTETIEQAELSMSPMALEGRDIYLEEGCAQCHESKTIDAAQILNGGLFIPQFPFQSSQVDPAYLVPFLLGPEHEKNIRQSNTDQNLFEPSDDMLFHTPSYPHLAEQRISGHLTQAKMLSSNHLSYDDDLLTNGSATTAGASYIEALLAYLEATSLNESSEPTAPSD